MQVWVSFCFVEKQGCFTSLWLAAEDGTGKERGRRLEEKIAEQ